MTLVWWAAAGSFAVPIVVAFLHACILPWPRPPRFIDTWERSASSGLIFGTVLEVWPMALAYGASLMLADLVGVVVLEARKRAVRRALAECHPFCRCRKCVH